MSYTPQYWVPQVPQSIPWFSVQDFLLVSKEAPENKFKITPNAFDVYETQEE